MLLRRTTPIRRWIGIGAIAAARGAHAAALCVPARRSSSAAAMATVEVPHAPPPPPRVAFSPSLSVSVPVTPVVPSPSAASSSAVTTAPTAGVPASMKTALATEPFVKSPAGAWYISGTAIAASMQRELKEQLQTPGFADADAPPQLCVIVVGDRSDSLSYVKEKKKAAAKVGIRSKQIDLPESASQQQLHDVIAALNADATVHGILLQLPLPPQLDRHTAINAIDPIKDVDGLTVVNAGKLVRFGAKSDLIACTPLGVMTLLQRTIASGLTPLKTLEGAVAVVVGRSDLVGKPVAHMLTAANATVTLCHLHTKELPRIVSSADVVVTAMGDPQFVRGSWIKPGAVVIDVGINAIKDHTKKAGMRLVGDCELEGASQRASAITPVPGGVGPMTVISLLRNTVKAYTLQRGNARITPKPA